MRVLLKSLKKKSLKKKLWSKVVKISLLIFMENSFLLVGLGNPGFKYADTRHNIGFMIIDSLVNKLGSVFDETNANYSLSVCQIEANSIILLKPRTYMNLSGLAVNGALHQYHVELSQLLVVYDDLNIPFGKLRLRAKGSDGGHRGVSSVIFHLQSQNFPRLRFGIGAQYERSQIVDFVLSSFDEREKELLPKLIQYAVEGCQAFILDGVVNAMNSINSKLINN